MKAFWVPRKKNGLSSTASESGFEKFLQSPRGLLGVPGLRGASGGPRAPAGASPLALRYGRLGRHDAPRLEKRNMRIGLGGVGWGGVGWAEARGGGGGRVARGYSTDELDPHLGAWLGCVSQLWFVLVSLARFGRCCLWLELLEVGREYLQHPSI